MMSAISDKEKIKNKIALQKELGLEENQKTMMIGVVSRLTDQKGFDLVAYVMDELCQDAVQIVVLGTGEEQYENMFRHLPGNIREKYLQTFIIQKQCPIRSMHPVMHFLCHPCLNHADSAS